MYLTYSHFPQVCPYNQQRHSPQTYFYLPHGYSSLSQSQILLRLQEKSLQTHN